MLASIYFEDIKYWNINDILHEDDVEIEDDEDEDDDEDSDEMRKTSTPDLEKEIYREDDETASIAECF